MVALHNITTAEHGTLISYTRAFPDVLFMTFLEAMPIAPRIYWESSQVDLEFAGGGAAVELYADGDERFETIRAKLRDLFADIVTDSTAPENVIPRVFGGFAFRDDFVPSEVWMAFPSAYFVLPRYQITRTHSASGFQTWLTINRQLLAFEHAESALDSLEWEFESALRRVMMYSGQQDERQTATVESLDHPLSQDQWRGMIENATTRMRTGEFDKVVLARTADMRLSAPANLLAALERMGARYPHTYRFLIEPSAGRAFFGASPELLAHVHDRTLETAALAGSRRRASDDQQDAALAQDLLTNSKDRYEHALVVDFMRTRLTPFVKTLNIPAQPVIMKLPNIQHLYTPVHATLHDDGDLLTLIHALHPTPAMGGMPQQVGVEVVKQLEPGTRGWFAAPIGWIDARGDGMFAVAIRSAVSSGKRVRLYAGAGIVADSDADKEWDEIELKFRPMFDALGVDSYART